MTYYKMLKAGIAISIEAGDYNKGLDPAIFWNDAEQNKIMVFAPEIGIIEYPKNHKINCHIENMIKEKFIVTFNPNNNYVREFIEKHTKRF